MSEGQAGDVRSLKQSNCVRYREKFYRKKHSPTPSGHNMARESTKRQTEMSTRDISWWGKGGRCVGLTILPPSCADCLEILEPQAHGILRACTGL